MVEECGEDAESRNAVAQVAANFLNHELPETSFGAPKAGNSKWASVVRVLNPIKVSHQSSLFLTGLTVFQGFTF